MRRSPQSAAGVALLLALATSPVHAVYEAGGAAQVRDGAGDTSATVDPERISTSSATSLVLNVPASSSRGSRLTGAVTVGTANVDVDVDVVTLNGGSIRNGSGLDGAAAFDYPPFVYSSTPPLAVMRVTNSSSRDDLAPGSVDFTFGADFTLDSLSTGSPVDNGNNLIQRGLYGNSSQYKIDVDAGNVSCRVKGSTGSVVVQSSGKVRPGLWYRVRCSRFGQRVQLSITEYLLDGSTKFTRDTRWGDTGSLVWSNSQTPLAVGGKMTSRGAILSTASDQFNGSVGKPMLTINS